MENYLFVWLDANIDKTQKEFQDIWSRLQCIVSTIDTFTDTDECINYLKTVQVEKIFVIVSNALSQTFIPLAHDLPQLDSIFILCDGPIYDEQWLNSWSKVKRILTHIDLISTDLRKEMHVADENSVLMSFLPQTTTPTSEYTMQIDPTFLYTQLLKEALLDIDFDEAKCIPEFVAFSRNRNAENPTELNKIDQFEHGYHDHTPVWWYTFECSFLYRALNRALGFLEVDTILKLGFFLRDLHRDLMALHQEQHAPNYATPLPPVVYRGQGLTVENFNKMKGSIGGLMSFNNFLSTSQEEQVAFDFIKQVRTKPNKIPVLFVMTIDPAVTGPTTTPFASIEGESYYVAEREILFSMNSVFRVDEVKEMDSPHIGIWQANLTLSDSSKDPFFAALINCLQFENTGTTGWTRLGQTLIKLSKFDRAEELYRTLIENTTDVDWNAHYYYMLGLVKWYQNKYQEAISLYEKAVENFLKSTPPKQYDLATAYNNIGLVHWSNGDNQKALEYYEKSLEIKETILPPLDPRLTSTYNNIGLVCYNISNYSKALSFYEKSIAIQKASLPAFHPDIAKTYNCVAMAHLKLNEFAKALEYYEKVLDIQKKSLPDNHPEFIMTQNNIGEVYKNMGDYTKALSYFEQTLAMMEKSLAPNDLRFSSCYDKIAEVYLMTGDYSKSLLFYEKTMDNQKQHLQPDHPDIAACYINLGNTYCCMTEHAKALSCFEKGAEILKELSTPDPQNLVSCYYNIGILHHNMSNYTTAIEFFKRCLEIPNIPLEAADQLYAYPYEGLGKVYQSMNDYATALTYYEKTLEIRQRLLPSQHPNLATAYSHVGDVYRLLGHQETALSYLQKALDIQENVKCDQLELATTYVSMGELLREMHDYSAALTYIEKGLTIREKLLPKVHVDLAVIHHYLAKYYHDIGKHFLAIDHATIAVDIGQQCMSENHPHLLYYKDTLEKFQNNN